jgi:hypothetical protein
VNTQDGVSVPLQDNTWYVIQKWDNTAPQPVHEFYAHAGGGSVKAEPESAALVEAGKRPHASPSGTRAWGPCQNQATARYEAERAARSFKIQNPAFRVLANGIEVQ